VFRFVFSGDPLDQSNNGQLKRGLTPSCVLTHPWRVALFLCDLISCAVKISQQFSQLVRQMRVRSVLTPQPRAYAGAHNVQIETVL
jgi:hypothetical protein